MHRSVTGDIRTISIKRDSVGNWFMTVTADQYADIGTGTGDWKREQDLSSSHVFTNPIGIDLGLKALITTSDGMQMEPPHFLMKSEKKLAKAQRQLSGNRKDLEKEGKQKQGLQRFTGRLRGRGRISRTNFPGTLWKNMISSL